MGRGVARRLLWGGIATLAVIVPAQAFGATGSAMRSVSGGVAVDASAPGLPAGWRLEHRSPGVFRFVATSGAIEAFDVVRWDVVAQVTIVPMGPRTEEVRFVGDDGPVDSAFSYTASVRD
jgi:hypothetical protein